MTVSSSTQIPKTSDSTVFQRQCKVLFEHILEDPNVKEYGSSGQGQSGIDLLGRRRKISLDHWVGIQCKLTIKSAKLKKGTVRSEANKALGFKPALKELILVTTAPDDASMDAEAAQVTDEQAKLNRDFTVQVWGWQTLETYILQHEPAIAAFSPDAFPHLRRVAQGQKEIKEQLDDQTNTLNFIAENVQLIVTKSLTNPSQETLDGTVLDTLLDREIDRYRELINDGHPRTALGLLENLWDSLPPDTEGRLLFRVKANIAACKLRLGEEQTAGELYLEAFNFAPTDSRAISLKVLGLLLLNNPLEAYTFGSVELQKSTDQAYLIAYLINACKKLENIDAPFAIIPPELENDPVVAGSKIDFLRTCGAPGEWWILAREERGRHPADENLSILAADADLDEACLWRDSHAHTLLPESIYDRVQLATKTLHEHWKIAALSENNSNNFAVTICANLATGYRLLRENDKAMSVINEGLRVNPSEEVLIGTQLLIALEMGDIRTAKEALGKLPQSRDVIFGQLQIYANTGNWNAVDELSAKIDITPYNTYDQAFFEALTLLARVKLNQIDDPRSAATAILKKYPDQAIVPVILYELADHMKDAVWSKGLYQGALGLRTTLNSATISMLARIAEREADAGVVVDLLDGHVDILQDTDELRMLARGFANSPVNQSSISFIEKLSDTLATQSFYARVIGSIRFNSGSLPQAEAAFHTAISADETDLAAHLGLIDTWLRQDNKNCVNEHIQKLDASRLNGIPMLKMRLAHIFVTFGRTNDGLALGYETALNNRDDIKAAQLYIGLILPDPTGMRVPSAGAKIQTDHWVAIERNDGKRMEFVIEAGPDRPSIDHYSPKHALAMMVIGRENDDEVTTMPTVGSEQVWRIRDHKHKYVALLKDIMETMHVRFPEATGVHLFQMEEDDIAPFLEHIKGMTERDEEILNYYLNDGYPLELVGSILGKSSIELSGEIVRRGEMIRTCIGTHLERDAAISSVMEARERGIVLDTYTAWMAYSLDLISTLTVLFGRVALPQAAIDALISWRQKFEETGDNPLMTVGYSAGKFFKQEVPADRLANTVKVINTGIEVLRSELEILPGVAPAAPSEAESTLLQIAKHGFLDPIYISIKENLLLVSDDFHFRRFATELHGVTGVWLQAVLMVAQNEHVIDLDTYADATSKLALQRQNHIALSAITLLAIARQDQTEKLERLIASAEFIGGETADLKSHFSVTWDFLHDIWSADLPHVRQAKAAGILLERLVGLLSRHGQLQSSYQAMIRNSARNPALHDYLVTWARGHFIELPNSSS